MNNTRSGVGAECPPLRVFSKRRTRAKSRTFEGIYKKTPDRPDSPQKEDMSGEKRMYGHPIQYIDIGISGKNAHIVL